MDPKDSGLLILKSNPQAMKGLEIFLKNRELKFVSTVQLKEALQLLFKHKPKYVLIPADHPNPKVKLLPKLLTQVMKVVVIGYTESDSSKAANQLLALGLEYNLNPPVSGPQIMRLFAKIQKAEVERPSEATTRLPGEASANHPESNLTHIHGEKTATPASMEFGGGEDMQRANSLLAQLMSDGESHAEASPEQLLAKLIDEDEGAQTAAPSLEFESGSDSPSSAPLVPTQATNPQGAAYKPNHDSVANAATNPGYIPTPQGQTPTPSFESGSASVSPAAPANASAAKSNVISIHRTQDEGPAGSTNDGSHPVLEVENSKVKIISSKHDSILLKGSVDALDRTVDIILDDKPTEKIESTAKVACLVLTAGHFQGYLIAALGKNRHIDPQLIHQMKEHLVAYLVTSGEPVNGNEIETLDIEITSVPFQAWAQDQADFLLKAVHYQHEVALAFFPTNDIQLHLEDSIEDHMLKISIDEVSEDALLDFDVFIYLPANGKYILYNKEGHTMFGDQKGHLKNSGVTHVHLRRTAQQMMKKYKARSFLNSKIREFEGKSLPLKKTKI